MHQSQPTMELHNSTHEVIGVILPEIIHSILAVDGRSIHTRISFLTGMMTITTGLALLEPRQKEPGRILEPIHVLPLVRDEIQSRVDSINPHEIVHLIFQFSIDPTAKNLGALSSTNSDSHERMTNVALTPYDSPQQTIQSIN